MDKIEKKYIGAQSSYKGPHDGQPFKIIITQLTHETPPS